MITAACLEQNEHRLAADPVGELAQRRDAEGHAQNRRRGLHGGLGEAEAESRRKITRHPDHIAVIPEVLDRTHNSDSDGRTECPSYLLPASETSSLSWRHAS